MLFFLWCRNDKTVNVGSILESEKPNLVKVDGHWRVAHLWRLVVGPAHGGKSHLCPSRAHWNAQRGGDPAVWGWVRVAHDKTLSFQDDGLRVVLAEAESNAASYEEYQSQHGTGSRTAHGHHGRITDPVHTNWQPLGGLLRTRSTGPDLLLSLFVPFSLSSSLCGALSLSQTPSDTQTHSDRLRLPSLLRVIVDFGGVFRCLWFETLWNEDANRDEVSSQTPSEKPL